MDTNTKEIYDAIKQNTEGYVYCYHTKIKPASKIDQDISLVKIGRTGYKADVGRPGYTGDIENWMICRYNGQYPDGCILFYEYVNNNKKAEKMLFKILRHLRYSHELYYNDTEQIRHAFDIVRETFTPIVEAGIKQLSITQLQELNAQRRKRSQDFKN